MLKNLLKTLDSGDLFLLLYMVLQNEILPVWSRHNHCNLYRHVIILLAHVAQDMNVLRILLLI